MSNVRYIRQPDSYGCGPTAIINALKWAGFRATLKKHYRSLVVRCKAKDPDGHEFSGTTPKNFQNALKYTGRNLLKIKHLTHPSLKEISQELNNGKAVVILHFNQNDHGSSHYTLLIGKLGKDFIAVNAFHGCKTVAQISDKIIKTWTRRKENMPMAWVLEKRKV